MKPFPKQWKKEKDIDIAKAKFDKETALFQIAITTAMNIIKLWLTPPLAIAAGVAGAAEAAIVLSKPLPKYAEGTTNHKGGLALIGEGKHDELVTMPGGKSFITQGAMIADLPAGTSVEPLVNGAMSRSMAGGMAYNHTLSGMMERKKGDAAWKIAMWQTLQMKKALSNQKRPVVRVNVYNDLGFNEYINNQVFK